MPAERNRPGVRGPRWATGGTRAAPPTVRRRWGGALALCFLTGWLTAVPGWAESPWATDWASAVIIVVALVLALRTQGHPILILLGGAATGAVLGALAAA